MLVAIHKSVELACDDLELIADARVLYTGPTPRRVQQRHRDLDDIREMIVSGLRERVLEKSAQVGTFGKEFGCRFYERVFGVHRVLPMLGKMVNIVLLCLSWWGARPTWGI